MSVFQWCQAVHTAFWTDLTNCLRIKNGKYFLLNQCWGLQVSYREFTESRYIHRHSRAQSWWVWLSSSQPGAHRNFPQPWNCSGSLQCPERPLGTSIWAPPAVPSVPLALPALTAPRSRKCCEGSAGFVFSTGALRQQNEGKNRRKQNQNPAFSFVPLITRKYELIWH